MNPAQKALLDALVQHQSYLFRASSQAVNEITAIFNKLSHSQISAIFELIESLTDSERKALAVMDFSSKAKTSRALSEIKAILNEWFALLATELDVGFEKSAVALAVYEATYAAEWLGESAALVSGEKLYKEIKQRPYAGGQLVKYLFSGLTESLRRNVEHVIRDGVSQGQTNTEIIRRIKGKRVKEGGKYIYKGGLLDAPITSIERQVRTARSHISTATYIDTYKALGAEYVKVVATLDGRTCKTCGNLDANVYHIDDASRPRFPIHPNNRTTYVPCDKDGNLAGKRPFVMDERKVKDIPKDERKHLIGQLDANTKFKDFFDQADEFFQRTWLGKTKYELYKKGGYTLDKFVDPLGKPYTIAQLKELDAKTFKELGL
ncbi:minor capsid protein [uncultured Acinetobacter sp.]|uniref:minor capsid protein n=1 Tax=uncultured Acinetobacter sp. TaxID=165433 RepID=UPI00262C0DAF|nr:minor capsid protein [uncultured Acinetobacter sp.]